MGSAVAASAARPEETPAKGGRSAPARAGFAVLAASALHSSGAIAHLRNPTVRAERRIELRLDESPMRVSYHIGFGFEEASVVRRRADRDGDGAVSAAEGNSWADAWTRDLVGALVVCLGPNADDVKCSSPPLDAVPGRRVQGWVPDGPGHLHFEWTVVLGVAASDVGAVRVEDEWEPGGVTISDVTIAAPRHTPLLSAGVEGQAGVSTELTWIEARREPGPRVIHATWQAPAAAPWARLAVGAAVAAGGAALALAARRARRGSVLG